MLLSQLHKLLAVLLRIAPRKAVSCSKGKRKTNGELFLAHFCKTEPAEWTANKICNVCRRATFFTGLITYESIFRDNAPTSFTEFFVFITSGGLTVLQWILLAITLTEKLSTDMHEAMLILPLVLTGAVLFAQGGVYYFWKGRFQTLARELLLLWNNELKYGLNDELIPALKQTSRISKLYLIWAIISVLYFLLRPLYTIWTKMFTATNEVLFHEKILSTEYPFAVDTVPKYICCILWETYTVVYAWNAWLASDSGFIQMSSIIARRLQAIGIEFRNIVQKNDMPRNNRRLMKRLCKVVRKHSELLIYCRRLDELFSPIMLTVLIYVAVALSINVIGLQKEIIDKNLAATLMYLSHTVGMFLQIFAYCDSCESISYRTENISQELYNCDWTNQSIKFKKTMLMIMRRAQSNYKFKVYGLYDLNRSHMVKIVLFSANLVTVIRSINVLMRN